MRTAYLAAVLLVAASITTATAQTDCIQLYIDGTNFSDCTLLDDNGLIIVNVVHNVVLYGAMGCRYALDQGLCGTMVYIADSNIYPLVIGNSQTGVSISYGACLGGSIHVQNVFYFGSGSTPPDCALSVVPAPSSASIEVVDCQGLTRSASGGPLWIKPTTPLACACLEPPTDPLLVVAPLDIYVGLTETSASFNIANIGAPGLAWTVSESASWLDVSPTSGSENGTVNITVDRTGLPVGTHSAAIDVNSNGGSQTVMVTAEVDAAISVYPTFLSYGGSLDELPLTINSIGSAPLSWTVTPSDSWLSAVPDSGTDTGTLQVFVDRTGLSQGITLYGDLVIDSNAGNVAGGQVVVPVSMLVPVTDPILRVAATIIGFSESSTSRTFDIENVGAGTLEWQVQADQPWIEIVPPTSGTGDATVTVNVDPALVPGNDDQFGNILVTSNGGDHTITVVFDRPVVISGGMVTLWADPGFTECNVASDNDLVQVYVVHQAAPAVTAVQYKLENNGHTMTHVADNNNFPLTIGNSQTGVAVSYAACLSSPIHIQTVVYQGIGTSPPCSSIEVVSDPAAPSGQIEAVDCGTTKIFPTGGLITINDDGSCSCTVPVQKRTWGSMRALFMELQKSTETDDGD